MRVHMIDGEFTFIGRLQSWNGRTDRLTIVESTTILVQQVSRNVSPQLIYDNFP